MLEFIQSSAFTRRMAALAKEAAEDVLLEIENDLLKNPKKGSVVQGTGGLRKARAADPERGKGKRGGFRYLYFYLENEGQIFLLLVFSKNERDDLDPAQKKWLKNNWEKI